MSILCSLDFDVLLCMMYMNIIEVYAADGYLIDCSPGLWSSWECVFNRIWQVSPLVRTNACHLLPLTRNIEHCLIIVTLYSPQSYSLMVKILLGGEQSVIIYRASGYSILLIIILPGEQRVTIYDSHSLFPSQC